MRFKPPHCKRLQGAADARRRARRRTLVLQVPDNKADAVPCERHLIVSVYRVPQMQGVGRADVLLYFKCPTTKQMRCPVNAYRNFTPASGQTGRGQSQLRCDRSGIDYAVVTSAAPRYADECFEFAENDLSPDRKLSSALNWAVDGH